MNSKININCISSYQPFPKVLTDINKRSYTNNFNPKSENLEYPLDNQKTHSENFKAHESFRFEGMSRDGDNMVLYSISFNTYVKGPLSGVNIACTVIDTKVIQNTLR